MKNKLFVLLTGLLSAISQMANAQVNVTNQGVLYISSSTDILYVNGDFSNNSGSGLTNNGKLYVSQTLTNNQSSMSIGTGTLYLNGTIAQSVSGSQPFRTYNLETNNSAGITLNNNLSVSGAHTYTAGLIASSATPNYLIYEAGSSYSGDNDSRHVTGWVKKYGNTNFAFPVGDATYERTTAISNLSASSEINCRYYTPTTNISNLTFPIRLVKRNEYWQIDKISGGTAQITLNWNHAKVPMDNVLLADILVAQYTAGSWTDAGGATTATGNVATTGSVTSSVLSSYTSPFTLGYKTFPVPLKLISFTAERRTGITTLRWITVDEQQVNHFVVERSYDAVNYTAIGNVAARNSGNQEHYSFDDNSPLRGFAYYRIKSVDMDGKYSYTRVAVVSETDVQANTFVVLNPAKNNITVLNKTGQNGLFDYRLFNAGGQLVFRGQVNMTNNAPSALLLPWQAASGVYVLELSNDKVQFRQRVLVER